MELPYSHSSVCHSNHFSFYFVLGAEGWMLKKAPDETGYLILTYGQAHNTIVRMAEVILIEAEITNEKSGRA